ncbi:hypothetical protein PBRA_006808 [Plasmodiophora brassicae]|uniref:Uncharacterized protein n=1 Tax=Plasmodiophora brassicae TaxID=37360 RepID=A0A0G4IU81_PLABS|nr:hypothetical protein PBRA_006808 [Plasmodiophora brassicae]
MARGLGLDHVVASRLTRVFPYASLHIDATAGDLLHSAANAIRHPGGDEAILAERVERHFGGSDQAIACLSVRSCLDLYLHANAFPKGSYVLMSAINIPDMSRVLAAHDLIPVPVDLNMDTLLPDLKQLEALLQLEKVVAFIVAHVYGRRNPLDRIVGMTRARGVPLIEDCAESFDGLAFRGHPGSDLISTAFGGGVGIVRRRDVLARMRAQHATYPVQSSSAYAQKAGKMAGVSAALNCPMITGPGIAISNSLGYDHKAIVVQMLRGFPNALMTGLRHQPSAALLATLDDRLRKLDYRAMAIAKLRGDQLVDSLPSGITVPGHAAATRNYWLFPVCVDESARDGIMQRLSAMGVDASVSTTQLACIPVPDELKGKVPEPEQAQALMRSVIYLPVHRRVPSWAIDRLAAALAKAVNGTGSVPSRL